MIFLIAYHRERGQIVMMEQFHDADRQEAKVSRLELELSLNRQGTQVVP